MTNSNTPEHQSFEDIARAKLKEENVQNYLKDKLGVQDGSAVEREALKVLDKNLLDKVQEAEIQIATQAATTPALGEAYKASREKFQSSLAQVAPENILNELESSLHTALSTFVSTQEIDVPKSEFYIATAKDSLQSKGTAKENTVFLDTLLKQTPSGKILENHLKGYAGDAKEKETTEVYNLFNSLIIEEAQGTNQLYSEKGDKFFQGTVLDVAKIEGKLSTILESRKNVLTSGIKNANAQKEITTGEVITLSNQPGQKIETRNFTEEEKTAFLTNITKELESLKESKAFYEAFKRDLLGQLNELGTAIAKEQAPTKESILTLMRQKLKNGNEGLYNKLVSEQKFHDELDKAVKSGKTASWIATAVLNIIMYVGLAYANSQKAFGDKNLWATPMAFIPYKKEGYEGVYELNDKEVAPMVSFLRAEEAVYTEISNAEKAKKDAETGAGVSEYQELAKAYVHMRVSNFTDEPAKESYNTSLSSFRKKYPEHEKLTGESSTDTNIATGTIKTYIDASRKADALTHATMMLEQSARGEKRSNTYISTILEGKSFFNDEINKYPEFRKHLEKMIAARDYVAYKNKKEGEDTKQFTLLQGVDEPTPRDVDNAQTAYREKLMEQGQESQIIIPAPDYFLSDLPNYNEARIKENLAKVSEGNSAGSEITLPADAQKLLQEIEKMSTDEVQKDILSFGKRIGMDLEALNKLPTEKAIESVKAKLQEMVEKTQARMPMSNEIGKNFALELSNEGLTVAQLMIMLNGQNYTETWKTLNGEELITVSNRILALADTAKPEEQQKIYTQFFEKTQILEKTKVTANFAKEKVETHGSTELNFAGLRNIGEWLNSFKLNQTPSKEGLTVLVEAYKQGYNVVRQNYDGALALQKGFETEIKVSQETITEARLTTDIAELNAMLSTNKEKNADPAFLALTVLEGQLLSYSKLKGDLLLELPRIESIEKKGNTPTRASSEIKTLITTVTTLEAAITTYRTEVLAYYNLPAKTRETQSLTQYFETKGMKVPGGKEHTPQAFVDYFTEQEGKVKTSLASIAKLRTVANAKEGREVRSTEIRTEVLQGEKIVKEKLSHIDVAKDTEINTARETLGMSQMLSNVYVSNMHLYVESLSPAQKGNKNILENIGLFYGVQQQLQQKIAEKRVFLEGKTVLRDIQEKNTLSVLDNTIRELENTLGQSGLVDMKTVKGIQEGTIAYREKKLGIIALKRTTKYSTAEITTLLTNFASIKNSATSLPGMSEYMDALGKEKSLGNYLNMMDFNARQDAIKNDLELNKAYLEKRKELASIVANVNKELPTNSPIVLTPEFFGFSEQNPYASLTTRMEKGKTHLGAIDTAKEALNLIKSLKAEVFVKNFTDWPSTLKNAAARGIKIEKSEGMFSPIQSTWEGQLYRHGAEKKATPMSTLESHLFNTLVLCMPSRTDIVKGKPIQKPSVVDMLSKHIEGIIGIEYYSPTEIAEAMMKAKVVNGNEKIAQYFAERSGQRIDKYYSKNHGWNIPSTRGEGKYVLDKAVILALPEKYYYIGNDLYRMTAHMALRDKCMNPNPGIGMMKLEKVPRPILPGMRNDSPEVRNPEIPEFPIKIDPVAGARMVTSLGVLFIPPVPFTVGKDAPKESGHRQPDTNVQKNTNPISDRKSAITGNSTSKTPVQQQAPKVETPVTSQSNTNIPKPELIPVDNGATLKNNAQGQEKGITFKSNNPLQDSPKGETWGPTTSKNFEIKLFGF